MAWLMGALCNGAANELYAGQRDGNGSGSGVGMRSALHFGGAEEDRLRRKGSAAHLQVSPRLACAQATATHRAAQHTCTHACPTAQSLGMISA
jgi:hypothetical protein